MMLKFCCFRNYCFFGELAFFSASERFLVLGRFGALGPPITVLTKIWNGVISRPKSVKINQVGRHSLAAKTPNMKRRYFWKRAKNIPNSKKSVVSTSSDNFAQPEVPGIYVCLCRHPILKLSTATRCLLFHKHICHPHPVRDLNMVHGLKFKPILKENMLLKLDSFPQFGDENIKYLKPAPKNLLELKSFCDFQIPLKIPYTDHPSFSSRSLTDSLICNLWLIIFWKCQKR